MSAIRPLAAAGSFYPADPVALRDAVHRYVESVPQSDLVPKALIVPHAGYAYSGPIAGSAYATLHAVRDHVTRVVLLGPAHYVEFTGLAASQARGFATPLGTVPIDPSALDSALVLASVQVLEEAHLPEHCLEVQLPFLQLLLDDFQIVPLLVGRTTAGEVGEVLDALWGGDETLLVVTSDLSHYHEYSEARRLDRATARVIESLASERMFPDRACGSVAIAGLLDAARRHGLEVHTLGLANSGDTAGSRRQVVGYGAFALAQPLAAAHRGVDS